MWQMSANCAMRSIVLIFSLFTSSFGAAFGCLNLFGHNSGTCLCDPCPPCQVRERPVYIQQPIQPPQAQPVERIVETQYQEPPQIAQHISTTRLDMYPQAPPYNLERVVDTSYRERPVCQSRRWTRSESVDFPEFVDGISGSSNDRLCNSPHLREAIMKNIRSVPENAKMSIAKSLPQKGPPFVVICSNTPFSFVTSHESEYCYGGENNTHCYVFSP